MIFVGVPGSTWSGTHPSRPDWPQCASQGPWWAAPNAPSSSASVAVGRAAERQLSPSHLPWFHLTMTWCRFPLQACPCLTSMWNWRRSVGRKSERRRRRRRRRSGKRSAAAEGRSMTRARRARRTSPRLTWWTSSPRRCQRYGRASWKSSLAAEWFYFYFTEP